MNRIILYIILTLPIACIGESQDPKQEFLVSMTNQIIEELCNQDGVYMECLGVLNTQCISELKSVSNKCNEAIYSELPFPIELDVLLNGYEPHAIVHTECLMKNHLDKFEYNEAKLCLDNIDSAQWKEKRELRLQKKLMNF